MLMRSRLKRLPICTRVLAKMLVGKRAEHARTGEALHVANVVASDVQIEER
ncbi:MAG: hypothetical protein RL385_3682 [Pseudomonadota bacterium]|jgi:hypothetical protein